MSEEEYRRLCALLRELIQLKDPLAVAANQVRTTSTLALGAIEELWQENRRLNDENQVLAEQ